MRLQDFVLDHVIRHRARFDRVPMDRYTIRVARTLGEYESAFRLVHINYAALGIEPMRPVDLRLTEQHALREAIVLVAYDGEQPVGTITVTGDSPAGLPLDGDYPVELGALRAGGAHLAEINSFAIVGRCRRDGLAQLLSIAATRIGFRTLGATHIVSGVHPSATPMYRAIWSFTPLGAPRTHATLRAPVAGQVVERSTIFAHVRRHFGKRMSSGSTLEAHLLMGPPLPCVSVPDDSPNADLGAFKMPRDVFRTLFVDRTDRLASLRPTTLSHLREQRTDETLQANSAADLWKVS